MENYDQQTETTADIDVTTSGSARITVESFTDENLGVYDAKDVLKFTQTVLLNTEQSKALYEQLKEHFEHEEPILPEEPVLPEEPEEKGLYATQTGLLLTKDDEGDWSYKQSPYVENAYFADCYEFTEFAENWAQVVDTIGDNAFPLMHITKSDIASLAQSKRESEE